MCRYVLISIKLKPYLKKYILHCTDSDALVVDLKSEFGSRLIKHLQHPASGWKRRQIPSNEKIDLRLPRHQLRKLALGHCISEYAATLIAQQIEELFWRDIWNYIQLRRLHFGQKELTALRRIRATYDISEEDYHEESMHKRYKRIKSKSKNLALISL
jgi:hypothetical protein